MALSLFLTCANGKPSSTSSTLIFIRGPYHSCKVSVALYVAFVSEQGRVAAKTSTP